jgi:tetratricopeptide (TPR) repeat protein
MAETHREEIAKLEALYAAHPEGRVFTHLAEAYRKSGDLERARQILEDGLTRHSDYSSAHVVLGRVRIDQGDTTGAAEAFRRVLELDRHNLVALRTLGEISAGEGRLDEALRYYRDLVSLDPTDDRLRITVSRLENELRSVPAEPAARVVPAEEVKPAEPVAEEVVAPAAEVEAAVPESVAEIEAAVPESMAEVEAGAPESIAAPEPAAEPQEAEKDWYIPPLSREEALSLAEPIEPAAEPAPFGPPEETLDSVGEFTLDWTAGQDTEPVADQSAEPAVSGLADLPGLAEAAPGWQPPSGFESGVMQPPAEPIPAVEGLEQWESADLGAPEESATEAIAAQADELPPPAWAELDAAEWVPSPSESEAAPGFAGIGETQPSAEAAAPTPPQESEEWMPTPAGELAAEPAFAGETPEVSQAGEDVTVVGATDGDMMTVTMAELYANQGIYDRAAEVYRSLLAQVPEDERLRAALQQVEARGSAARAAEAARPEMAETAEQQADEFPEVWLESVESAWTGGDGVAGAEATPYAWAETPAQPEPSGPRIADYFQALLSWKPGGEGALARSEASAEFEPSAAKPAAGAIDEVVLEAGAVEAAFEEWFGPGQEASEASETGEERPGVTEPADEADADLEMFRSWLQSLKK